MPLPTPATEDKIVGEGYVGEIPNFLDAPLDDIYRDNVGADIVIGQHEGETLPKGEYPSEGNEYYATELEVHLTNGPESNYATGKIVPEGHTEVPSEGTPLAEGNEPDIITIDIDTQLMSERFDADEEITRIFTGVISNASKIEHGMFEFMAFWPGFNEIQNGKVLLQYPGVGKGNISIGNTDYEFPKFIDQRHPASTVAEQIAETVTQDNKFDYTVELDDDGYKIGTIFYGIDNDILTEGLMGKIVTDEGNEGVLQRIVKSTNSVWDVDRYGNFHIGPPLPERFQGEFDEFGTSITSHKLRYMTDTTAGKNSPGWRSVLVIGDGVVSQDGWRASNQFSSQTTKKPGEVVERQREAAQGEADEPLRDQLAKPIFEYTNLEINTQGEATHVMEKLREEIRSQAAEGEITVVGHPEIWPGDAIELPDTKDQPYDRERYGVRKVVHRLNNSDGYITKIGVAGQTNANANAFSDELRAIGPSNKDLEAVDKLKAQRSPTGVHDFSDETRTSIQEEANQSEEEKQAEAARQYGPQATQSRYTRDDDDDDGVITSGRGRGG